MIHRLLVLFSVWFFFILFGITHASEKPPAPVFLAPASIDILTQNIPDPMMEPRVNKLRLYLYKNREDMINHPERYGKKMTNELPAYFLVKDPTIKRIPIDAVVKNRSKTAEMTAHFRISTMQSTYGASALSAGFEPQQEQDSVDPVVTNIEKQLGQLTEQHEFHLRQWLRNELYNNNAQIISKKIDTNITSPLNKRLNDFTALAIEKKAEWTNQKNQSIWIEGFPSKLTLKPGEKRSITFYANIPEGALDQDWIGSIFSYPYVDAEKVKAYYEKFQSPGKKMVQFQTPMVQQMQFPIHILMQREKEIHQASLELRSVTKKLNNPLNFVFELFNSSRFAFVRNDAHLYVQIFNEDDQLLYENEASKKRNEPKYNDQGYIDQTNQLLAFLPNQSSYLEIPWFENGFPKKGKYRIHVEIPEVGFVTDYSYEEKRIDKEIQTFEKRNNVSTTEIPTWILWALGTAVVIIGGLLGFVIHLIRKK